MFYLKVAHPSTPSANLSAEACRGWALFDRLNCPNKYFGVLLYICTSLLSNKINYMVCLSFAMEKKYGPLRCQFSGMEIETDHILFMLRLRLAHVATDVSGFICV